MQLKRVYTAVLVRRIALMGIGVAYGAHCETTTLFEFNIYVCPILHDLSAASVTVNHKIIISTLADLGIGSYALTLFSSYLQDQYNHVEEVRFHHLIASLLDSLSLFGVKEKKVQCTKTSHLFI